MGIVAWIVLIWGVMMVVSAFVIPFMIGRHHEPYTAATASWSMFFNIGLGILLIVLAGAYLNGGAA